MFDKVFDDTLHRHAHLERSEQEAPPNGAADVKLDDDDDHQDLKAYQLDIEKQQRWDDRRAEFLRSEAAQLEAQREEAKHADEASKGNVVEWPVQIDAPSTGSTTANDELDQLAAEHTGDAQSAPPPDEDVFTEDVVAAVDALQSEPQEETHGIPAQGSNEVRPDDIGEAAAEEGATDRES